MTSFFFVLSLGFVMWIGIQLSPVWVGIGLLTLIVVLVRAVWRALREGVL